jgi:glycosyltransferase involved in cell wall biosynthesis
MPNVVLEALASGLPVIGTDVPGTRDLVEPDRTGYLVPPADPGRLASVVERLIDRPELVRQLGENSRHAALAHGWSEVARQYRRVLSSAVRSGWRRPFQPVTAYGRSGV